MPLRQVLSGSLASVLFASAVSAAVPFSVHRDDPRRADPPVARPAVAPCVVEVIAHKFDSDKPALGRIDAARRCRGPWQKIVLELMGTVNGRQYDRIGMLQVGGVTVLRTSTPEPSGPKPTAWTVEKDLTEYAPLFTRPQDVAMNLGNFVDKTYTGIFDVHARLLFYPAGRAPAAGTANLVAPLADVHHEGADTVGKLRLPANAERLLLEVYATGSGGGCEEFWYDTAPDDANSGNYSCKAGTGPYREVQVLVDGQVAGIAAPYPHIYTGGWSNPILWYLIPAPRTFDIKPVRFELTPFIGKLNDGRLHEVRLRVLGVPAGKEGWALFPNVQLWSDRPGFTTTGELLQASLGPLTPVADETARPGTTTYGIDANHRFVARGTLRTSHGVVETSVERSLSTAISHEWATEELHDGMRGDWTDRQSVTRRAGNALPVVESDIQRFGLEGAIDTAKLPGGRKDAARVTTTISIYDEADTRRSVGAKVGGWKQSSDRFDGVASFNMGVPREKREATSVTHQEYRLRDSAGGCYRRELRTQEGKFVEDSSGCGNPAPVLQPAGAADATEAR